MFLDELGPIFNKLVNQPVAFVSGFVSGVLRLSLADEPLKSWLEKQGITPPSPTESNSANNGNSPQSINIE